MAWEYMKAYCTTNPSYEINEHVCHDMHTASPACCYVKAKGFVHHKLSLNICF